MALAYGGLPCQGFTAFWEGRVDGPMWRVTGHHRVKILADKAIKGADPDTGKERPEVVYYFEEDGERKYYKVPVKNKEGGLHCLVERLAECREGQELILEYKRRGLKGYIEVIPMGPAEEIELGDDEDKDLPVISADVDEQNDSKSEDEDEADIQIPDTL